jgi:hypothetical protein
MIDKYPAAKTISAHVLLLAFRQSKIAGTLLMV